MAEDPEPRKRSKTILQAASDGSQKDVLIALRRRLASSIQSKDTPPRDLAALSRRLMEVMDQLEAIEAQSQKGDGVVEVPVDAPFDPEAI